MHIITMKFVTIEEFESIRGNGTYDGCNKKITKKQKEYWLENHEISDKYKEPECYIPVAGHSKYEFEDEYKYNRCELFEVYGGGPSGGFIVIYDCNEENDDYWEVDIVKIYQWHQDWGTPKYLTELKSTEMLFGTWGVLYGITL